MKNPEEVYTVLKTVMEDYLIESEEKFPREEQNLQVILIVGVNGVGKTTTIGKIAAKLKKKERR